eukprot:gene14107-30022_t
MPDYSLGKIYKIVCNVTGEIYVGSTTEKTLARRLTSHVTAFKRFNDGKKTSHTASFYIIERSPEEIKEEMRKWYLEHRESEIEKSKLYAKQKQVEDPE